MHSRTLVIGLLFVSFAAHGESSEDFARMGHSSWAAFECSALAGFMGKDEDAKRLFDFGYEQGMAFFKAVKAGKVNAKDIDSITPSGFLTYGRGPTDDFALGRVYESASEDALKDVITDSTVLLDDVQKTVAASRYSRANCEILGRH